MKKYAFILILLSVSCVHASARLVKFQNSSGNLIRVTVDSISGSMLIPSGACVELAEGPAGSVSVNTSTDAWSTPQIFSLTVPSLIVSASGEVNPVGSFDLAPWAAFAAGSSLAVGVFGFSLGVWLLRRGLGISS